jgi:cellulose synthase/poly-beta-1,6-N-acetylglucosamine synthase-like glycosyltransferase
MISYNESFDDLMKTVLSIMENCDFMKHSTRFHDDELGTRLKLDFASLEPVIVPIFDGMQAIHPSMREWLEGDMPGSLEGMDGPSSIEKTEVRACSAVWWYYTLDSRSNEENARAQSSESLGRARSGSDMLKGRTSDTRGSDASKWPSYDENCSLLGGRSSIEGRKVVPQHMLFHVVPILKRNNHRKHNSHHWFFQGVCVGLNASLVFLTDCGTTFNETCLARMVYELRMRKDLIGVTARQRVEMPNPR